MKIPGKDQKTWNNPKNPGKRPQKIRKDPERKREESISIA
jgi:hypothetical protein